MEATADKPVTDATGTPADAGATPAPLTRKTVTPGEYEFYCGTEPMALVTVASADSRLVVRFPWPCIVLLRDIDPDARFVPVATVPAHAEAGLASRLHAEVMNLPCGMPPDRTTSETRLAELVHSAACCDAAELILQPVADLEQQRDELLAAYDEVAARLTRVCNSGGTMQEFLDAGSLRELARIVHRTPAAAQRAKL